MILYEKGKHNNDNKYNHFNSKYINQQERLLNTEKIGRDWRVHLPECRAYWNIPYTDEKDIYYDLKY